MKEADNIFLFAAPPEAIPLLPEDQYRTHLARTPKLAGLVATPDGRPELRDQGRQTRRSTRSQR